MIYFYFLYLLILSRIIFLQEKLDEEYQRKLEENKKIADEKTAKKRAKRLKKKLKAKLKEKKPKVDNGPENKESSDSEDSDKSDTENTTNENTWWQINFVIK